jgi:nucleoside-diphosphate-sugar epimerase
MRYLVTGGAGFIGSNTVDELSGAATALSCLTIFLQEKRRT